MARLKGEIPLELRLEHGGSLTYSEERAVEAFMYYSYMIGKTQSVETPQPLALARMLCLLDSDTVQDALTLWQKNS